MMGKVIMSGIVPQLVAPSNGIKASELAVGSTVKLMENGVATEYMVVNQGIPGGSSLYDSSCDGLWLLRKACYTNMAWHSSTTNRYGSSTIHTYLNGTFYNLFGSVEKATIKQAIIPYNSTNQAVSSGSSGLSAKAFLLGAAELGWSYAANGDWFPIDGGTLSYFSSGASRIGYYNGTASFWWLRAPYTANGRSVWCVNTSGGYTSTDTTSNAYVRPAVILPSTAVFDEETLILKGVI